VNPPGKRRVEEYKRGVSRGLLPVCGDIPVIRVLLRKFDSRGVAARSDKGYNYRGSSYSFDSCIWDTMARRYGVSVGELEELEGWLDGLPSKPLLLRHPTLDRIVEADTCDIQDRGVGVW